MGGGLGLPLGRRIARSAGGDIVVAPAELAQQPLRRLNRGRLQLALGGDAREPPLRPRLEPRIGGLGQQRQQVQRVEQIQRPELLRYRDGRVDVARGDRGLETTTRKLGH